MGDVDDEVSRDFFTYGLHRNAPKSAGYFLAHFCFRYGGSVGARLPDPAKLARLLGITDSEPGALKANDFAAITAFLSGQSFLIVEPDGSYTLSERGAAWWAQYQRAVTPEMLHPMLLAAGLGRVAEVIEQQARPSIRLTAHLIEDEEALPIGASKLGGTPDLPPGFVWPVQKGYPLAFIAQINLADVTTLDAERLLPQRGLLHFFYGSYNYYSLGTEPETDMSSVNHVAYFDGDFGSLTRTPMPPPLPDPGNGPYLPCTFTFAKNITLADYLPDYYASWNSGIRDQLGPITEPFTPEEQEAYSEVQYRIVGPAYTINRMLGHGDPVQGFTLGPEDALVLQIDSEEDTGMMWGDAGRLYWWMPKEDLRQCDFTRVQFDEQCS